MNASTLKLLVVAVLTLLLGGCGNEVITVNGLSCKEPLVAGKCTAGVDRGVVRSVHYRVLPNRRSAIGWVDRSRLWSLGDCVVGDARNWSCRDSGGAARNQMVDGRLTAWLNPDIYGREVPARTFQTSAAVSWMVAAGLKYDGSLVRWVEDKTFGPR